MRPSEGPQDAAQPMTPSEMLHKARKMLNLALIQCVQVIQSEDATPASVNVSMAALAQAQQHWNQAVVKIPIAVMTLATSPEEGPAEDASPSISTLTLGVDGRDWAQAFMSANKNNAVGFDGLALWFAHAIEAGQKSVS